MTAINAYQIRYSKFNRNVGAYMNVVFFNITNNFCCRPGSVIADIVISVNQSGEAMDIKDFLAESVTSGYLGQLAVDSKYFEANIGGI